MKYINKSNWASVRMTPTSSLILCLKSAHVPACLYFENIDQLLEAIRKRQIHVKNWVISLSDNLCIEKYIDLPATNMEQAYKMLEFEFPSHLPLPPEELVYSCVSVGKSEGLLKVLVYTLKVKTLEDILTKFKSAGIKPSRVMVDSVAIWKWFSQNRNTDINQINILFTRENVFVSSAKNNIFQKHEKISLQEDGFEYQREYIIEEINHFAMELFTTKQPVLKIAANTEIQSEIKSWFDGNYTNIEFLEVPQLNYFVNNSASTNNLFIFESVVAQGLVKAIEDSDFAFFNLLPRKTLKKTEQKQLITNIGLTTILGVFVVFCLWLNFFVMNWRIQRFCKKITMEIAPIKHISADVESKRQKVKAIKNQLANRRQIGEIFSQLYRYSPRDISISQMSYTSDVDSTSVNIKGQADTLSSAFEYSDALKESTLLNNIQIINAQQIPRPGGSIVEFKAECILRGS